MERTWAPLGHRKVGSDLALKLGRRKEKTRRRRKKGGGNNFRTHHS